MSVKLKSLHHVGVPVRDMQASLDWYRDMFGVEASFVAQTEGDDLAAAVQLEAARLSYAFLELDNTVLELLQYDHPVGVDFELRNCDVGAVHIAFEVEDIQAAYRELEDKGARFSAPPNYIDEGPMTGHHFAYFRDPDGVQLELFQRPG